MEKKEQSKSNNDEPERPKKSALIVPVYNISGKNEISTSSHSRPLMEGGSVPL